MTSSIDLARAEADRRGVFLAQTPDGDLVFGRDGSKWRHGWIPLNAVAAAMKAKRWKGHGHTSSGARRVGSKGRAEGFEAPKTGRPKIAKSVPADDGYAAARETLARRKREGTTPDQIAAEVSGHRSAVAANAANRPAVITNPRNPAHPTSKPTVPRNLETGEQAAHQRRLSPDELTKGVEDAEDQSRKFRFYKTTAADLARKHKAAFQAHTNSNKNFRLAAYHSEMAAAHGDYARSTLKNSRARTSAGLNAEHLAKVDAIRARYAVARGAAGPAPAAKPETPQYHDIPKGITLQPRSNGAFHDVIGSRGEHHGQIEKTPGGDYRATSMDSSYDREHPTRRAAVEGLVAHGEAKNAQRESKAKTAETTEAQKAEMRAKHKAKELQYQRTTALEERMRNAKIEMQHGNARRREMAAIISGNAPSKPTTADTATMKKNRRKLTTVLGAGPKNVSGRKGLEGVTPGRKIKYKVITGKATAENGWKTQAEDREGSVIHVEPGRGAVAHTVSTNPHTGKQEIHTVDPNGYGEVRDPAKDKANFEALRKGPRAPMNVLPGHEGAVARDMDKAEQAIYKGYSTEKLEALLNNPKAGPGTKAVVRAVLEARRR